MRICLLFLNGVWYRGEREHQVVYWTVLSGAEINIASMVDEALVEWYWGGKKTSILGERGPQWLRCCATNRKVAGSIPASVIGFFIDITSFRLLYGPGVDSAANRYEYQEYFLGVKAAGA